MHRTFQSTIYRNCYKVIFMKKKMRIIILLSLFLFLLGTNIGINNIVADEGNISLKTSNTRPKVVCYMSITEDWTRELLQNVEADIHVLVSGEEDVHSYDPSSEANLAMDNADLFVRLNIPIEAYAADIVAAFPSVPTVKLWVNVTDDPVNGYSPRKDDVWKFTAPFNMHMWTSPSIAKKFVNRLAQGLKSNIGTTSLINNTIDANLLSYQTRLNNTIDWLDEIKKNTAYTSLKLVPFHPAFIYYLEDDLNLTRVAVIEQQPGVDPPVSHLADLYAALNDSCTIIWHPQEHISQKWAQDVSVETGANITMLTPLLPISTPAEWVYKFGAEINTFLEMVEFNTYQLINSSPYMAPGEGGEIPGFEIFIIFIVASIISVVYIIRRRKSISNAK